MLNQFSCGLCLAAGRLVLQNLLHSVCCGSAWVSVMLCALNFPALEQFRALQIAQLDVTLNSSYLPLYNSQVIFCWFGLFCFVFNLITEKTGCQHQFANLVVFCRTPKALGVFDS